jgi:glyoxylase-like metal-dependent hydrolase (beta-lactamase superfamily II)
MFAVVVLFAWGGYFAYKVVGSMPPDIKPGDEITPALARQAMKALFGEFPPEWIVSTGFQRHDPVKSVNKPDSSIPVQAVSKWELLQPGHQLDVPEWPEKPGVYHIQRLTENTWWVFADLYSMTLYVGENEALIIDMPEFVRMDELFANIDDILNGKPLTTLVYSHPHTDHIGAAKTFVEHQQTKGVEVNILGTQRMIREMDRYQMPLPRPNVLLDDGRTHFEFDGKSFIYATVADWAHTGADAYVITPDKVLTIVDIFYGNRLPLHDFSGVQNMNGWVEIMRHLAGEDWVVANIGHVNVAHREGLLRSLEYTKDVYDTWFRVAPKYWSRDFFPHASMGESYVATFLRNLFDKICFEVALELKPKWGHLPHWTLAHDHAMKVQWDLFLNYRFRENPEIRPSFEAVVPDELKPVQ